MRNPVPRGENGFTFAHIKASFREIADFPSSSKNTGPWTTTKEIFQKHGTVLEKQQQIVCSCLSSQVSVTFFLLVVAGYSVICCFEKPNKLLFCISAIYWDKQRKKTERYEPHTHTYLYSISSETRQLDIWVAWEIRPCHVISTAQHHHSWGRRGRPQEGWRTWRKFCSAGMEEVTLPGSARWILLWRQLKASAWPSDGGLERRASEEGSG